ncbi:MAG: S1 RNA-binding domain-containing protein [Candidatus Pelagibacterales bacterium]|nr:MAG: S1 RNA-binding domain-containing protein [Pelagibacterales bacterium]|tara:strand:+ start:5174 stop:6910 length:1737 start_codon:yes stop_codon:yes gene_type:complete
MEEIYRNTDSAASKEFEKLLNTEFSKSSANEGDIVDGKITKITEKVVYVEIPGAKSEGMIELSELKALKEDQSLKIGSKLSVAIEKLENKDGDIVISREKARKMKSWKLLEKAHDDQEEVEGNIYSKIKGGFIVDVKGSNCFLPGSQVDLKPLKNIDYLMNKPQRFLIIKCDKVRGNVVVSRRAILEKIRDESKEEILSKYKEGDIVEGICKGMTAYGVFFDIDGFDCMCHINEISWSRISHPDEMFSISQKQKLKIINIDSETKKISVSIKLLSQDPFETKINNYKVGEIYPAEVKKIMDYGLFLSLEDSLEGLCHQSELSHSKKNISAKKLFKIGQKISVLVKEIDMDKRRISLSYKDTLKNPWDEFESKFPVGTKVVGKIKNVTDFGLFIDIKDSELTGMVHYKDLSYNESEQDLEQFAKKKDEEINLKVLEIDKAKEKIRLGAKQLMPDPLDYFKDKKRKDVITVVIKDIVEKGIKVSPDNCEMTFLIKKSAIAVEKEDQRVTRFTKGDRLDVMIQECDLAKRKVVLSVKMLEEEENKTAIKKYGSVDSGKSLPFADLPSTLKKVKNKKEKEEE